MTPYDLGLYAIGVGIGFAVALAWMWSILRRYVIPCGNANCPHHQPRPTGRQH